MEDTRNDNGDLDRVDDGKIVIQANGTIRMKATKDSSPSHGSCEMCQNYEFQLQMVQKSEEELRNQLAKSQEIMHSLKDDLRKERSARTELEDKFREESKASEIQLNDLLENIEQRESDLSDLRDSFEDLQETATHDLTQLLNYKEDLCREVVRLSRENDTLLGRNIAKSREMQSEIINLPQDITGLQFYLLKLQEEFITMLVAKERNEETQKSELRFLQDSTTGEIEAKDKLIEELTIENDSFRTELEQLRSTSSVESAKLKEQEEILEQCQQRIASLITEHDRVNTDLNWQLGEMTASNSKLTEEVASFRNKIQSLQVELDNSEVVQRDFVKLSQSLQIQLEKIRQADSEVRWQHEDDVSDCNNCRKRFTSKKDKHHCSHCGRIFCTECSSKIIHSGPNRRSCRVCFVCHTLLDHETAPYFSSVPPQS
ncbi:Rab GTPase-binding effector protein 1 [Halotydeus destructor]|nr:Rab GTPase-binding effector protein 1 [Halotydeus destructor]